MVSTQHDPEVTLEQIRKDIVAHVVKAVIPAHWLDAQTKFYVNPNRALCGGRPCGGLAGLRGEKSSSTPMAAMHGMAAALFQARTQRRWTVLRPMRHVMWLKILSPQDWQKNARCSLPTQFGVAHPISIMVEAFGTSSYTNEQLAEAVRKVFDLRPSAIIRELNLRRPIYRQISNYGQLGREDVDISWEKTDRAGLLMAALK